VVGGEARGGVDVDRVGDGVYKARPVKVL
jgi:hypothetical protein